MFLDDCKYVHVRCCLVYYRYDCLIVFKKIEGIGASLPIWAQGHIDFKSFCTGCHHLSSFITSSLMIKNPSHVRKVYKRWALMPPFFFPSVEHKQKDSILCFTWNHPSTPRPGKWPEGKKLLTTNGFSFLSYVKFKVI